MKSTAAHVATLCPEQTKVFNLPTFPEHEDPSTVCLLFPSPFSKCVSQLEDLSKYTAVMAVDTTWHGVAAVLVDPHIATRPYQHVHIGSNYHTLFWRTQPMGPSCLSTIEAVYLFLREFEVEKRRRAAGVAPLRHPADIDRALYDRSFDNLLVFFKWQYDRVQFAYTKGQYAAAGRGFTGKMRPGYIKYEEGVVPPPPLKKQGYFKEAVIAAAAAAGGSSVEEEATKEGGEGEAAAGPPPAKRLKYGGTAPTQRIHGAWAVRTDLLSKEAAMIQKAHNDNFLNINTKRVARAALAAVDGALEDANVGIAVAAASRPGRRALDVGVVAALASGEGATAEVAGAAAVASTSNALPLPPAVVTDKTVEVVSVLAAAAAAKEAAAAATAVIMEASRRQGDAAAPSVSLPDAVPSLAPSAIPQLSVEAAAASALVFGYRAKQSIRGYDVKAPHKVTKSGGSGAEEGSEEQ